MSRFAVANVVVAGHGTSDGTENEPPSVSVSSIKIDGTRELDEVQRYLDQQDYLIRNVQNVNNAVISMREMMAGFQQQLSVGTEENHDLRKTS